MVLLSDDYLCSYPMYLGILSNVSLTWHVGLLFGIVTQKGIHHHSSEGEQWGRCTLPMNLWRRPNSCWIPPKKIHIYINILIYIYIYVYTYIYKTIQLVGSQKIWADSTPVPWHSLGRKVSSRCLSGTAVARAKGICQREFSWGTYTYTYLCIYVYRVCLYSIVWI